jgi:PmbA protein
MKDIEESIEFLQSVLEKDARVDGYEIYASKNSGISIEARDGEVDSFKVRSSIGVGLRTLSKSKPGFSYSTALDKEALSSMVELSVSSSSGATADKDISFVKSSSSPADDSSVGALQIFDQSIDDSSEEEMLNTALLIEESAKGYDTRVKRVRKASYGESGQSTRVLNSEGLDVQSDATYFSASVMAVAEGDKVNGEVESQMGWDVGMSHKRADIDAEAIGKGASERAVSLLGGKSPGTLKCAAVFENTVVMDLLGALSGAFLGDNVAKGKSMLGGKVGKKVVSDVINLIDDGQLVGGWSSARADAEGSVSQRTPLLSSGVLQGFLYDTYWAKRAGKRTTGNSVRHGFKGAPTVGTRNLFIEAGEKKISELFSEMGKGLFITELMGVHTIDSVSGDFSLGATGFMVEAGEKAYPVRGMAISGNLLELFSGVECVGGDLRFIGSTGAPSLLFSEVDASGA